MYRSQRAGSSLAIVIALAALASGCAEHEDPWPEPPAISAAAAPASAGSAPPPPVRPQLDGRAFPDRVLAITYDDGPDVLTPALARYLHDQHVSATFFVVGAWREGVSSDPGEGDHVFHTGADAIPILQRLITLGHRVEDHTENHVLLGSAAPATVIRQLRAAEARIDRESPRDLRLFRVPGGAWSAEASRAVDADPVTRALVGPIRWDIDGKDWECSLYCRSDDPAAECEPAAPGGKPRVKPAVVARRYLDRAERAGRGIVLFHDRVGHVGSHYALDIAHLVIPALRARGFVFAAPVLAFAPFAARAATIPKRADLTGDLNGDGRRDRCDRTPEGVACAFAGPRGLLAATTWARAADIAAAGVDPSTLALVDANGDGRADLCGRTARGVSCAAAP